MRVRMSLEGLGSKLTALGLLAGMLAAGCISEGARPDPDALADVDGTIGPDSDRDSNAPDSEPETGVADASQPETDDTRPGSDVPGAGACEQDDDCAFLALPETDPSGIDPNNQCHAWRCNGTTCVFSELSGDSCDDASLCTESDFCDGGTCSPGFAVDCGSLSAQCWTATSNICVPESGCQGVPEPAGVACDDNFNEPGGTCVDGWYLPYDECDGAGRCQDLSYLIPSGIHPLAGDWHAAITTVDNLGTFETLRADLVLGQFGGVDAKNVASSTPEWQSDIADPLTERRYCADISGAFTLALGEHAYAGFSDPTRSLIVFGSELEAAVGIAIRPVGESGAVNGTYRVVYTARENLRLNTFATWQGTMDFEAGCLVAGSVATTPAVAAPRTFAVTVNGSCFEPAEGSTWGIDTELLDSEGNADEVRWSGAIGANGDVLLLTRVLLGALDYGTVLLIRDRDTASRESMTGSWGFFSQRGGVTTSSQSLSVSIFENGYFQLGDSYESIGGYAHIGGGEDEFVTGQWWFTSAAGQYSHRIAIGEDLLHQTGYIVPDDNMIVGWRAKPPESNPSEPQALRLTPLEGSLFVALRLLPFAELPEVLDDR